MILRQEDSKVHCPEFFFLDILYEKSWSYWKTQVLGRFFFKSDYKILQVCSYCVSHFFLQLTARLLVFYTVIIFYFSNRKKKYSIIPRNGNHDFWLCQNNRGEIVTSKCCMHKNASSSIVPCVSCWPQKKNIKYSNTRATVYVVNIWPPFLCRQLVLLC